jgi:hypothetical protein
VVEEPSKCRHVAIQDPTSAAVIEDPASSAAEILATTTATPDATPPLEGNLARLGARIDHNRKRN